MTGTKLGIGFIGSGFVTKFHLEAWRGVRDADVLGVYSPNTAHSEAAAARARITRSLFCSMLSRR
jgi:predicted dehydrogenase